MVFAMYRLYKYSVSLERNMAMLLRPMEVRRIYRLSHTSLFQLEKEGKLNPLKTPKGHRRYRTEDLHNLLSGSPDYEAINYVFHIQFDNYEKMPNEIQIIGNDKPSNNETEASTMWYGDEGPDFSKLDWDKIPCISMFKYKKLLTERTSDGWTIETHPRLVQLKKTEREIFLRGNKKDTGIKIYNSSMKFCKFEYAENSIRFYMHDLMKSAGLDEELESNEMPMFLKCEESSILEDGTMAIIPVYYECKERI
jgi:hypothetical protein